MSSPPRRAWSFGYSLRRNRHNGDAQRHECRPLPSKKLDLEIRRPGGETSRNRRAMMIEDGRRRNGDSAAPARCRRLQRRTLALPGVAGEPILGLLTLPAGDRRCDRSALTHGSGQWPVKIVAVPRLSRCRGRRPEVCPSPDPRRLSLPRRISKSMFEGTFCRTPFRRRCPVTQFGASILRQRRSHELSVTSQCRCVRYVLEWLSP